MEHLITAPFLLPLLTGALLMALGNHARARHLISLVVAPISMIVAWLLLTQVAEAPISYQLGSWAWPYGIELYMDRLSASLVMLSATIALVATLPAILYDDARGRYFLALIQFQLAGINGSFMTGDLFNLFVCFEIMLISSYALLVHGHVRVPRAGLIYTAVNLTGSALFLFAVAMIYGATGSLNIADITLRLAQMPETTAALGYTGLGLLALVFALKSALLPLGLWLPGTYAIASPAAVTVFALLTKVGIYALMRVFGPWLDGDVAAMNLIGQLLQIAALTSIVIGALFALASHSLRQLSGSLVVVSVATAMLAVSVGTAEAMSAALYYTLHSTLAAAALFLIAASISRLRGVAEDDLAIAPAISHRGPVMMIFLGIAVIATGLPPLSGFIGKLGILQVLASAPGSGWTITLLLTGSLISLLAVVRAGNAVFLRSPAKEASADKAGDGALIAAGAAALVLALSVLLTVFAGPIRDWTDLAGEQITRMPEARLASPSDIGHDGTENAQ